MHIFFFLNFFPIIQPEKLGPKKKSHFWVPDGTCRLPEVARLPRRFCWGWEVLGSSLKIWLGHDVLNDINHSDKVAMIFDNKVCHYYY